MTRPRTRLRTLTRTSPTAVAECPNHLPFVTSSGGALTTTICEPPTRSMPPGATLWPCGSGGPQWCHRADGRAGALL
eukprot:14432348-Alexandrium_andersonii.AAC.1